MVLYLGDLLRLFAIAREENLKKGINLDKPPLKAIITIKKQKIWKNNFMQFI